MATDETHQTQISSSDTQRRFPWRHMLVDSPLSVMFFAPDGQFKSGNRSWEEQWSTTADDWHDYNILHDPQIAAAGLDSFFARGFGGEAVEISPLLFDPVRSGYCGTPRWIQQTLNPVFDDDGTIQEVVLIQQDVSEFKHIEDVMRFLNGISSALSFSLNRDSLLERVTHLAVPYLADWCFVDLVESESLFRRLAVAHASNNQENQANVLQHVYELRSDEPHGTARVMQSGQPEIIDNVTESWRQSSLTNSTYLNTLHELGAQAYLCIPLLVHGRRLGSMTFAMAESGRSYGKAEVALAEELARRAALAVVNAQLYREAQEANRTKDEFLMVAAHELRTPLTTLVGYAHMLLATDMSDAAQQQALQRVEQESWSLVQIVNDIVDVSRVIAGKIQLDPRPLEISPIIETAAMAVRPAAEAKGIELIALNERCAGIITGDASRLQQVFWHLLSNAVKFTPAGGRIEIKASCPETHVRVEVRDTGIGINPEFLPFVFERFRQLDSSMTRQHEGLGLGLAIVRYLVELHGGHVRASSKGEGQGSTFTVDLPMVAAINLQTDNGKPYEALAVDDPTLLESLRILAVEKDEVTREYIATELARYGADVRASASAVEALTLIADWDPDVLVSDMSMPGIDGYALIRKVRKLDATRGNETPAVALTTHMRTTDRLRTLSAGYQAHLAKPLRASELALAIADLTGRLKHS